MCITSPKQVVNKYQLLQNYQTILSQEIQMSRKIKYKIVSCSGEENDYPVSSLLVQGSQGWQTPRFCSYPQQITLQFYGLVQIQKLELISDSRKIASSVDILYFLPTSTENRFTKYGSIQFNRNQNHGLRQQKTLMVDFKCLYLRFLFNRPHKSKQNFFSQVGLHQISVYGSDSNTSLLPLETMPRDNFQRAQKNIYEQEDAYVYEKLMSLNSKKEKAIIEEDYQEANTCKLMMDDLKKFGYKLRSMQQIKKKAIQQEDYEKAKQIKNQIQSLKLQIDDILNSTDNPKEQNPQYNQFADQQMQVFINKHQNIAERHSEEQEEEQKEESKPKKNLFNSRKKNVITESYDERVIPTLAAKIKTQQSQVQQEDPQQRKQNLILQPIDGKFLKDAHLMEGYFDEDTIKKLFSRHWQHKVEALTEIQASLNSKNKEPNLVRCLINITKNTIRQTNLQVSQIAMSIFQQTLKMNTRANLLNKPGDMVNDLDVIIVQAVKKLVDSNQKVKLLAQQLFSEMVVSNLYGVDTCCSNLIKTKGKTSAKLLMSKISQLSKIVDRFGVGQNAAPISVIEFAFQNCENPAGQVRNAALHLLILCSHTAKERVDGCMENAKPATLQIYEEMKSKEVKETKVQVKKTIKGKKK